MAKKKEFNEETLKKFLKKEAHTLIEISDYFDVSVKDIQKILTGLKERHYNIKESKDSSFFLDTDLTTDASWHSLDPRMWDGDWLRFGFTSDNHLGNIHSRLDVLHALYDLFVKEGIGLVYNGGNMIDGEHRFNKNELIPEAHGMTHQVDYFAKNYPFRSGIDTKFVVGDDHEGWYTQREGINIGEYMVERREALGRYDLEYLGYGEADICLSEESQPHKSWMRLVHSGGGSAYATSYTMQKLAESYQGGEKPTVVLAGHYHKYDVCFPREIHMIQMATTCDQTMFMRKKKIQAMVGGGIVEMHRAPNGAINRVKVEWIPFYDKEYYTGKDQFLK
jgi:hypothetical protein